MGIKTKFNPMGGRLSGKGDLSEWYYNTYVGQTPGIELKVYAGFGTDVYVPKRNTILQDYVNDTAVNILRDAEKDTVYTPADLSELGVPDHIKVKSLAGKDYINVTNPAGTVTYNNLSMGGSPDDTYKLTLPKDWTEVYASGTRFNFVAMYYQSPFYGASTIVNLDLQGVQWANNSMSNAFFGCSNLAYIKNINSVLELTTRVEGTFSGCSSFNQNVQIPSSVTNMANTFSGCSSFNQSVQIPSSVTNMANTFNYCSNLNQNIQIPNSVTNMANAFNYCSNLNQNIQIPNSVQCMNNTFHYCTNLNQSIQIPNSVRNLISTFNRCYNLNQNIEIPNFKGDFSSLIPNYSMNMRGTFHYCNNMGSCWINIYSPNVASAMDCFNSANASCIPNVFIIADALDGTKTATYNAVKEAGWTWSDGNAVGTSPNQIRSWSIGWSNSSVVFNGTHCILNVWHGRMDTMLNGGVTWTTPQVPEIIKELGANYPVAINRRCFRTNSTITGIDLGTNIPWVGNVIGSGTNSSSRNGACQNCFNLTYAKGVIRGDVTDASSTFDRCYNIKDKDLSIVWPDSATKYYVTYEMVNVTDLPPLGEGAANIQSMCFAANALVNYPVIPHKVTAMTTAFSNGCSASARGNIFILSPSIASANAAVAGAFFRSYNASNRRNIYIFYNYSNGTNTTTKTTFMKNAIYRGTSGNGTNPMYNSTSNIYVYNLSASFSEIWNSYEGTTSTTLLEYNKAQQIPHIGVFPQYPDYNVTTIGNNCFNGARNLITLALYNRPFNSTNLDKAFNNCQNLTVIQGLNLDGVTSLVNTFNNCRDLRVFRSIPDSVVNMANTFYNCQNFDFNVQIGNGVTDMYGTFSFCNNLNQNILAPDSTTNMSYTFYYCTNLNKNIQIPNSVVDASRAFYRCDNLNQNIQIPEGITNIVQIFGACYNLNQNIQIPNSIRDMSYVFQACNNLNQNIKIPSLVTSMYATFSGCSNLNQNIQVPIAVADLSYAFADCVSLEGNISILSQGIATASSCFSGTTLSKNVFIPFKYSNGVNTQTFNSFKTAGYILPDGTSNNQHGVTVYDLNEEV